MATQKACQSERERGSGVQVCGAYVPVEGDGGRHLGLSLYMRKVLDHGVIALPACARVWIRSHLLIIFLLFLLPRHHRSRLLLRASVRLPRQHYCMPQPPPYPHLHRRRHLHHHPLLSYPLRSSPIHCLFSFHFRFHQTVIIGIQLC